MASSIRDKEWKTWSLAAVVVLLVGLLAVALYSVQVESDLWSVLAFGIIVALASFALGAVPGLLFGVPRSPGRSQSDPTDAQAKFVRNSNLVDVSDWLTKILVGVGLTQVGQIGDALGSLGNYLSDGFGDADSSAAFGVAVFLYFFVSGFLLSYLMTSRYLAWLLDKGTVREEELEAELVEAQKQTAVAIDEQGRAELGQRQIIEDHAQETVKGLSLPSVQPGDEFKKMASDIEKSYVSMSAGPQRTRRITEQTARTMSLVRTLPDGRVGLKDLEKLHSDGKGGAIVAMAAIRASIPPQVDAFDLVIESITSSQTSYEQYEALRALENIGSRLDPKARSAACTALDDQRSGGDGQWITPGTDRFALARSLDLQLGCGVGEVGAESAQKIAK